MTANHMPIVAPGRRVNVPPNFLARPKQRLARSLDAASAVAVRMRVYPLRFCRESNTTIYRESRAVQKLPIYSHDDKL